MAQHMSGPPTGRKVVVIGQGYVGLPVAVRAAEVGFDVVGFDLDERKVAGLREGRSHVEDISDERLAALIAAGTYRASLDPADLAGFEVAVVSVPTPLTDGAPDLSYIEDAGATLAPHLTQGCCVILESTTYPGTTEEVFGPVLEAGSGLRVGTDFRLGYSPERIDPGNPSWHLENTPKVVSGVDAVSLAAVQGFFDHLVDKTVPVSGCKEAELTKLLENTFRHVNIALVNELAMFAHELDMDVWEAIDAASTKPFGYMRFVPGPGVGGHCLPIDPSYLSWRVRRSLGHTFRFVELANDVNEHMPDYVVRRVMEHLNDRELPVRGQRVVLLGMAYKRNTGDARETPSVPVARQLRELGAEVVAIDPHVEDRSLPEGVAGAELTAEVLASAAIVVLLVDHDAFDLELVTEHATAVLDCRHVLRGPQVEQL